MQGSFSKPSKSKLATAVACVALPLFSSMAMGQYQSSNRLFYYNSSGQVIAMSHNGQNGTPVEQYRWTVPNAPTGNNTPGGIVWDHARTGAFYIGRGNTVQVMFDNGTTNATLADTWTLSNMPTNGTIFDMAYFNDRLYVTADDSQIRVYNAYTGDYIHSLSPYGGGSRWRGIAFTTADGGNGSSDNFTVADAGNGRWTTFNSANNTENSSPSWNIGSQGGSPTSVSQRIASGNYYFLGGTENSSTITLGQDSNRWSSVWTSWGQSTSRDIAQISDSYWITTNYEGGTMWGYNNGWNPGQNWGDSQFGQGSIGPSRGIEYKGLGNPTESPIRFTGFTGLNDFTISADPTSGIENGSDARTNANGANLEISDLISRLNSGTVTARGADGSGNAGNGDATISAAIDYDGLTADRTLSIKASRNVTINAPISDSDTLSARSLNLSITGDNAAVIGTNPVGGAVDINAAISLTAGNFTSSSATFDNSGGGTITTTGNVSITTTAGIQITSDVSGGNVSLSTASGQAITIDAPVAATSAFTVTGSGITVSSTSASSVTAGTISLNGNSFSAGGNVTAGTLNSGGGSYNIEGGTTAVTTAFTGGGSVNVNPGGTLSLGSLFASLPQVNMVGGTLQIASGNVASGTAVTFTSGTVSINGNVTNGGNVSTRLIGSSLGAGKAVEVSGQFNVASSAYTIQGGSLHVGSLSGSLLTLASGELGLTNQNLQVGGSGGGFNAGVAMTVGGGQTYALSDSAGGSRTGTLAVASNGQVNLSGGTVTAGTGVVNGGTINFTNDNSRIIVSVPDGGAVSGAGFTNNRLVKGTGRIDVLVPDTGDNGNAVFMNAAAGEIRLNQSDAMVITSTLADGSYGTVTNAGQINVTGALNGSTYADLQVDALVDNSVGGRITAQNAALRFAALNGDDIAAPVRGLTNRGRLQLSGTTNIFGSIRIIGASSGTNGQVVVSGGGTAYFNDDVVFGASGDANNPNAKLTISGGAAAVFYGDLRGDINVVGDGTMLIEGGFSPGFSPGAANIAGSLSFSDNSTLTIELGGTTPGTGYDTLRVGGQLALDGDLNVSLYGGFIPTLGQAFNVISAGSLVGTFDGSNLDGDAHWLITQTGNGLIVTFVPEPGSLSVLAGLGVLLGARRRRA